MEDKSLLVRGNDAFQQGDYVEALRCYKRLLTSAPEALRSSIEFNRQLTCQRLQSQHGEQADDIIQQIQQQTKLELEIETIRPHFDEDYYLKNNPDVAEAGVDPVLHFCAEGWREKRDPNHKFSTHFYLGAYQDVRDADINPYWHYVITGRDEGRLPNEYSETVHQSNQSKTAAVEDFEILKPHFDVEFYIKANPDVTNCGADPVEHYINFGWKEGRNPSPDFSTDYYLEANPDVLSSGINPFLHYIQAGRQEGRLAQHPGGYRAEILANTRPLEETVGLWKSKAVPNNLLKAKDIIACLLDLERGDTNNLMVSLGHDNYVEVSGGVQLCIQREQEIARQYGFVYLNLHPYQPLPRLAHPSEGQDVLICLVLNGEPLGVAPMSQVVAAFPGLKEDFSTVRTVVHHFMGHNPEQIADLVKASGHEECWIWLHDFFTICPSYALQRNNISFCGAPDIESNACRICLYGKERHNHKKRMFEFFERVKVHVVAPSEFTAEFWSKHSHLPVASLSVVDHVWLDWRERDSSSAPFDGPITMAFVGYPAPHKGWPVFEKLTRSLNGIEKDIRFVYFGVSDVACKNVDCIPVQVSASEPDAMIRALRNQNVDFVVHWASCAETFSFSTFEALAAGAFVLTNRISGNVAKTVQRKGLGIVFGDEEELELFFRDGRAEALVEDIRRRRFSLEPIINYSEMSFSVL